MDDRVDADYTGLFSRVRIFPSFLEGFDIDTRCV